MSTLSCVLGRLGATCSPHCCIEHRAWLIEGEALYSVSLSSDRDANAQIVSQILFTLFEPNRFSRISFSDCRLHRKLRRMRLRHFRCWWQGCCQGESWDNEVIVAGSRSWVRRSRRQGSACPAQVSGWNRQHPNAHQTLVHFEECRSCFLLLCSTKRATAAVGVRPVSSVSTNVLNLCLRGSQWLVTCSTFLWPMSHLLTLNQDHLNQDCCVESLQQQKGSLKWMPLEFSNFYLRSQIELNVTFTITCWAVVRALPGNDTTQICTWFVGKCKTATRRETYHYTVQEAERKFHHAFAITMQSTCTSQ